MRVLVIGAAGQLGTECCKVFANEELFRADLGGAPILLDVCNAAATDRVLAELCPDVVINTAAAHDAADCETRPAHAFNTNAVGARNVARASHAVGARLLHISTDYVFNGMKDSPYAETDLPMPLNVYGASKLAGEHLIAAECRNSLIVRTSGLYGHAPCRGKGGRNFVEMMLHRAAAQPEVKVVTDEVLTPTSTVALARQLRTLSEKGAPGLYHATCQGQCSWHAFAAAIFEIEHVTTPLIAVTHDEFPSPVKRPAYSVLDNAHLRTQNLDIMPPWRDALEDYLRNRPCH